MKNTLFYICLTGFAFTFSCCSKPVSPVSELVQITIDPDKVENYIDISPMLSDSIDIIPLETTDESLLSNIGRLIFHKGHFYILDGTRRGIFVFDEKGRFVRKIGKQGGGPGEYSSILFFDVMGDSLFVSSMLEFKSFIYDLPTGKLIKQLSHRVSHVDGFSLNENIYLITNYGKVEQENFNLCQLDLSTGKSVEKFMPFDEKLADFSSYGLANYTGSYKDTTYILFPYNDTIYQMTQAEVVPAYKINFTARNLPKDMLPIDVKKRRIIAEKGYVKGLEYMQFSRDYIWGMYADKYSIRNICINRHTLEANITDCFVVKKLGYLPLSEFYVFDESLISIGSVSSLKVSLSAVLSSSYSSVEEKYRARLQELQKNLTEDSNPVLFRYRFKENN